MSKVECKKFHEAVSFHYTSRIQINALILLLEWLIDWEKISKSRLQLLLGQKLMWKTLT